VNRRWFLRSLGAAAVGIVATEELLEILAPKRTIFLPPRSIQNGVIGRYEGVRFIEASLSSSHVDAIKQAMIERNIPAYLADDYYAFPVAVNTRAFDWEHVWAGKQLVVL